METAIILKGARLWGSYFFCFCLFGVFFFLNHFLFFRKKGKQWLVNSYGDQENLGGS